MCFKDIYARADELKDLSIESILDELDIDVTYMDVLPLGKDAMFVDKSIVVSNHLSDEKTKVVLLHEIGHYLFDKGIHCYNHRTEENNANIFMCLYLVHNEIWDSDYFDEYLIYQGVPPKVARYFNETVWQFKRQHILQLAY